MPTLSLVIPAYRSTELLGSILAHVPDLKAAAEANGFSLVETIVVDDGNPHPVDVPSSSADGVPVYLLRNDRNMGKGFSVRRGALAARGGWVLMSDMDESVPLAEFSKMAPFADRAMVCGSRSGAADARPLHRRVLSRLFNILSGTPLKDTQCGFKLFNMALMRPVFERQRTDRFAFDVELVLGAPSVAEVPVAWHGGRRSSLKVWRDAPRMLWDLFLIRIRR